MAYVTNNMEVNLYQDRENGEIFQHFGHTEQFKIYDMEDGKIISSEIVNAGGSGHGALAAGELDFSPNVRCDHHDHHGEGHSCGSHGCGHHSYD